MSALLKTQYQYEDNDVLLSLQNKSNMQILNPFVHRLEINNPIDKIKVSFII